MVEPSCFLGGAIGAYWFNIWGNCFAIIHQVRFLVLLTEVIDPLSIQGLQMTGSLVCILRFELNGLNTHDAHEIIGWITKFWTFVSNVLEVVHRLIGLVEVYDFSFSEQHQLIKHSKDV